MSKNWSFSLFYFSGICHICHNSVITNSWFRDHICRFCFLEYNCLDSRILKHWEDPEGWSGEGGGRGDQDGEYM